MSRLGVFVSLTTVVTLNLPLDATAGLIQPEVIADISAVGIVGIALNTNTNRLYATDSVETGSLSALVRVFDTATIAQVAEAATGVGPQGVAVNPITNRVYAINVVDQSLSVIDGNTSTLIDILPGFGFRPRYVAVNPTSNRIYVANGGNGSGNILTVIDGATNTTIQNVIVGRGPEGLAINTQSNRIYTPNQGDNTVSVVDGETNKVLATISVGRRPLNLAVDESENRIYVSNSESNTVSVIDGDTNEVVATIPVGEFPRGIAFDELSRQFFVTNQEDNNLYVLDIVNYDLLYTIPVGLKPVEVIFDAQRDRLYVANAGEGFAGGSGSLSVIGSAKPDGTTIPEPSILLLILAVCFALVLIRRPKFDGARGTQICMKNGQKCLDGKMGRTVTLCGAVALLFALPLSPARATKVFSTDFSVSEVLGFSGGGVIVPVQGFEGVGNTHGEFSGNFLWNDSSGRPARQTKLTLTGLPSHSSVSLSFLFATIESWDGSKEGAPSPDFFNVEIDGVRIFSETFIHHYNTPEGNQQTYAPPLGGVLTSGRNLWGNVYLENGYDMGMEPSFQDIPHSISTLEIAWFASGAGWQGGPDESWAIDNVVVSVSKGSPIPVPSTLMLVLLPLGALVWHSVLNRSSRCLASGNPPIFRSRGNRG